MFAHPLRWLLPLALLNGLLFLVLVPPWQHYDEPTHVEYAALIAYHGGIPTSQAVDPALRREIAASMYRHAFYPPGVVPDLFAAVPAPLGSDQTVHPPLYYALAAMPIRLMRFLPIEWQLYAARLLSLGLYVAAVGVAWRITTVITPDEPQAHSIIPALLLATPTFADLMTAVNNDVLVNFAALSALLAMAHLIRTGMRPAPLMLLALAVTVAMLTKRTGLILIPLAAIALFWSLRRTAISGRERLLIGGVIGGGFLALSLLAVRIERDAAGLAFMPRGWLIALDATYLRLGLERWLNAQIAPSALFDQIRILSDIGLKSFWLRFGWGQLGLGPVADTALIVLIVGCMAGLLRMASQQRGELQLWETRWIWLMAAGVGLGWLSLGLRFGVGIDEPTGSGYVPRGRYIFTMMLPHLWLLALGWQGLFPPAWRRFSLVGAPALFAIATAATWLMLGITFWRT